MVIRVKITELTETTDAPSPQTPTIIGVSDKKDYIVKLTADAEDTSDNIVGLRLYLGCHKGDDTTTTTNNCRLSVIGNRSQRYSAINPINPESNDTGNVLRYIIPDEDVIELTDTLSIEIRVQLETSQDSNEDRTPLDDHYVLKAHVEYTRCSTPTADASIHVKVFDLDLPPPGP